jgi:hypothetical protein
MTPQFVVGEKVEILGGAYKTVSYGYTTVTEVAARFVRTADGGKWGLNGWTDICKGIEWGRARFLYGAKSINRLDNAEVVRSGHRHPSTPAMAEAC